LLHGAAHDHIVDLAGLDSGPLHCRGDDVAAESRRGGVVKGAAIGLADWGSGCGYDYCFSGHADLLIYYINRSSKIKCRCGALKLP
jgi:hypothetical protein